MNCKPGDLAVIVRTHANWSEWIGRIVTVVRWDGPYWQWELDGKDELGRAVFCDDAQLRPIRNPGDDARDETLDWLPVPTKELA